MVLLVLTAMLASMAPQDIGAGYYQHIWDDTRWAISLEANGDYLAISEAGERWEGTYSWDAKKRNLVVKEKRQGATTWYVWIATLDAEGHGYARGDLNARIRLWQSK